MWNRHPAPGLRILLLAMLVVCAGCTAGEDRAALDVPAVELVEELRLDPNAEDFSVVGRIWVGPKRQLVVPLPQDRQIRMYDSSGARIAAVGREGSGPGEFQSLSSMGWTADTLWVFDIAQRRVTFIAPDGQVLRAAALPAAADRSARLQNSDHTVGYFAPSAIGADGSMTGEARTLPPTETRATWPGRAVLHIPAERADSSLEPEGGHRQARIVAQPPAYEDPRWYMEASGFGNYVPFGARAIVAYANDGRFAYLTTELGEDGRGTFTLTVFDAAGDTTLARSYPFEGIAIPARVRDSALAAFIPAEGRPREGPADLPQRFQDMARERMPGFYPPVMAMVLGLDDSIWLTMRDTADARRALILNGDGDPLGSLSLPPRMTIRQATSTHVWVTQTDEDGLASVLRYRVRGGR